MKNTKISRKALKGLVSDSMREAIGKLELPKASRKVKKLIAKSSAKIAAEFNQLLKKEKKKARKAEKSLTYIEDVLTGKERKKKNKKKKSDEVQLIQSEVAE
jgi:hypothetical protein